MVMNSNSCNCGAYWGVAEAISMIVDNAFGLLRSVMLVYISRCYLQKIATVQSKN